MARKQHSLLKAHNYLTPSLKEAFSNLIHAAEGEKGVAWADLNLSETSFNLEKPATTTEHSGLSVSQKALFDTFLVHASPARRLSLDKHSPATMQKPVGGILTKTGSTASNTSNASGSTVATEGAESETSAGCDSGVGCGGRPTVHRSVSDASSSAVSSLLSSRLSSIPDKPRMPTPIDDITSSCSSNNSVYDTRLNTVLNSYHQKPSSAAVRAAGWYTKLAASSSSRGATPTPCDSPQVTPRGTPEPYLTPLPSLHKLTLQLENTPSSNTYTVTPRPTNVYTETHTPSSQYKSPSSRMVYSSSSGDEGQYNRVPYTRPASVSAFTHTNQPHRLQVTPRSSTSQAVPSSDAYMQLIAKATRLQSAPLPSLRTAPPPAPLSRFEDNFVSLSRAPFSAVQSPFSAVKSPALPPKGLPASYTASQLDKNSVCLSKERGGNKRFVSRQESSSSHSSSSTVKSVEPSSVPRSHGYKPPPVVTVETHSTVVSVHPSPSPASPLPNSTRHSVNIGVSHAHRQSSGPPATTTRSRPPAFVAPPPFNSSTTHTHSSTSQTTTASTTKPTSSISSTSLTHKHESSRDRHTAKSKDAGSNLADESQLNSTFTVVTHSKPGTTGTSGGVSARIDSGCGAVYSAGVNGGESVGGMGLKRQYGVSFKPVPCALKMLHVNSPHALDHRDRGNNACEL